MANRISGGAEEVSAVVAIEEEEVAPSGSDVPTPQERKMSWQNLRRHDSLYLESRKLHGRDHSDADNKKWSVILQLAFQSIGVVYGDIGTSPLYVYAGIFPEGIKHEEDVLGAMSLIFYTLTLIPVIKYVFIVLRANDNGDGGTFALYSLICRYAKLGLIPNAEMEDGEVSNYQLNLPNRRQKRASRIQSALENSHFAKVSLLFATMLGTAMVIGDGVLTPCISVLSAVGGITGATPAMTEVILVFLFMAQRLGTNKVGYTFAPIIFIWFAFIAAIGVYNFFKYDPTVIKALNPAYIIYYFQRNKKDAWISLGGVVLCITGAEALFADVGHFSIQSIQLSMSLVTYPALICAYAGQSSFLRKHSDLVSNTFYKSTPESLYWPMFVVAVLASIIASQAMISGTFSIIQQSLSLGCFPRVKVVHTSAKHEGQVYVPEINYLLMLACVCVTLVFKNTTKIGNAYGIAVVFVMTLTSSFLVLIMVMIWKTHILLVITYVVIIGSVELVYLSSVLYKFDQGGYLPLAFAAVLMTIMYVWNSVFRKKYFYELSHKISPEKFNQMVSTTSFRRLPGMAFFYTELVQGIPPIIKHYVEHVPALQSVLVFVTIKSLPVSKVPAHERFLFRRVEAKKIDVFHCVVRYGYTEVRAEHELFEKILLKRLEEFKSDRRALCNCDGRVEEVEEDGNEFGGVADAWKQGVVHFIGETEVVAKLGCWVWR
ncbi:Potassium transporter 5, partial [Cucurbita argyrosperma subsp. sororia]